MYCSDFSKEALSVNSTTGAVTVNHDDTSNQNSVDNSGRTFIQDITLDTYGHVTGLTSAAIPTLNQDTSGTAAIATSVTVADESTDTTCFPLFV